MTKRAAVCAVLLCLPAWFHAAAPIQYTLSFPEPAHRWMQVAATFPDVTPPTLELRMSRSSPGRYSLHDFAKNVYDVHAFGRDGRELETSRPDPYGWNVTGHGGSVRVEYKVFGDRVDGTYLAVDETHAHINMPAALMWAHQLEDRPATIVFQQPVGASWRVATQLHAGAAPLQFTAPNLQYLMDSPAEFGPVAVRQFTEGPRTFAVAMHHTGTDAELDGFVNDVRKIVRQEGEIFGEYPAYEPGAYTFVADYLPYAVGDGMEHRNSTIITSARSIANGRASLLDGVAHEFFHCWNVERIRPAGLEPFDFDRANISDSLWLAEGFTEYYGPLVLRRAGLVDMSATTATLGWLVDTVTNDPGRRVRSAVEMSRMAPYIDGERNLDRTNWSNTVISYYAFGGAIALALDLSLRERSHGALSLDDYMRAMWRAYGKPGGAREGYVDRPYSLGDAEETLATISSDREFAHEFFAKYISGRDVADYARLLAPAGFVVRKQRPRHAWLGDLRFDAHGGSRITGLVAPTWPVYSSGLDEDDELQQIDGQRINGEADVNAVLARHKPGDHVPIVFADHTGRARAANVTLVEDPRLEVVPIETTGAALTDAQRQFREHWLKPQPHE